MTAEIIEASPAAIDYAQRLFADPLAGGRSAALTAAPPELRVKRRIERIVVPQKFTRRPDEPGKNPRHSPEQIVIGLSTYGSPFAFELAGSAAGVAVNYAVWASDAEPHARDMATFRGGILEGLLRGSHPGVRWHEEPSPAPNRWPFAGLVLGVPGSANEQAADGSTPTDRLVRSLQGLQYQCLVLASPVQQAELHELREQCLKELRDVQSNSAAAGAPNPLSDFYVEVVRRRLERLSLAQSIGGWRTAVYLLGDEQSYSVLTSAWQSVFAANDHRVEPLRMFEDDAIGRWAARWALPDTPDTAGPGYLQHPYASQTVLTSTELGGLVALPSVETPGFRVEKLYQFDTVPAEATGAAIPVGNAVARGEITETSAHVALSSVNRHVLISGVTGSGKTNTVLGLLLELDAQGVPFMVIEPAKAEYRSLLSHPQFRGRLRVITAGRETVSPMRISPFDTPGSVATHIDLLRVAFGAAFGMWTPLPQVLERCLHEVYADRGWDLALDDNRLADKDLSFAFPTVSDLMRKVTDVLPTLGYDEKIRSDLQASLTTRLNSLRIGGKGRMFDVARTLDEGALFDGPVVIELEALGSDDDKAFLMSLLLIKLAEHRRVQGPSDSLRHVLVIEEAHRLLSQPKGRGSEEEADPKGQAVEAFTNLLAEVRAYGQGVIIADQVPVRLASEVMKNTAVKIAHRVVAAEDRNALAGTMAMTADQAEALTTLRPGAAVLFTEGEDAPVLVQTPLVKGPKLNPPDDSTVRASASFATDATGMCATTCADQPAACELARSLVDDAIMQNLIDRAVTSALDDASAIGRCWADVVAAVRARLSVADDESAVVTSLAGHAAEWVALDRGLRFRWRHKQIAEFTAAVADALLAAGDRTKAKREQSAKRLLQVARDTHTVTSAPFASCDEVCPNHACLYRRPVERLLLDSAWRERWVNAALEPSPAAAQWGVANSAAYRLIDWPSDKLTGKEATLATERSRRVALCFAQQVQAATGDPPATSKQVFTEILSAANGDDTEDEPTDE